MKKIISYLPTALVVGIITYVSLLREPSFSLPAFQGADKVAHIMMYAVLSCVLVWDNWRSRFSKYVLVGLGACALYGGLIEILQEQFCAPRTGSWDDFAADVLGCGAGLILFLILWKCSKKS